MDNKNYGRLILISALILIWFGGCTVIRDISTEEVRNPYTREIEHVQKQYLTWEKSMEKIIFFSMITITGAFWKVME